jgi:N utilization substance protein A
VNITESIRQLVHNKGVNEELVLEIVKEALLAAYKKKFGSSDNAETRLDERTGEFLLFSRKEVVDEVTDELTEISLEDARYANPNVELGDELLMEVKPEHVFDRISVQTAKQVVLQNLRKLERNITYNEFKAKEGDLVNGTFQRERYGNIYVDLGRAEAFLPKREQSPREHYSQGDRIKAVILEVREAENETQIILSRANKLFIHKIFEKEVPEIEDRMVEIVNISREVGFRTKVAVSSKEIDPVGACVGMKGMRIQNIVKELEGEKIDIVRFSADPREYIKNALTPAVVERVVVVNEGESKAIAVVDEKQLMLAIGKQGQNVKLASKLTSWNIDIKTLEQFADSAIEEEAVKRAKEVFKDEDKEVHELSLLSDYISENVLNKLEDAGIFTIEELLEKSGEELTQIPGIGPKTAELISSVLSDVVEVEDDENVAQEGLGENEKIEEVYEEVEVYQCPECGAEITLDMTKCASCGIEFEFEE